MNSLVKMTVRNLLLISSSTVNGYSFLQYVAEDIKSFLEKRDVSNVLFIPYASPNHDDYFEQVNDVFNDWGFDVESIHKQENPVAAVSEAESIFIGGGNTFLLLKTLYEQNLIDAIRQNVLEKGTPYIGASAGSNVATVSINTTNDMPIVYPPSFDALNLVPFNINPHYLDPDSKSKHKGETRDARITQFLDVNKDKHYVLGMREGSHILIENDNVTLRGFTGCKLFINGKNSLEFKSGSDLSFLIQTYKKCDCQDRIK